MALLAIRIDCLRRSPQQSRIPHWSRRDEPAAAIRGVVLDQSSQSALAALDTTTRRRGANQRRSKSPAPSPCPRTVFRDTANTAKARSPPNAPPPARSHRDRFERLRCIELRRSEGLPTVCRAHDKPEPCPLLILWPTSTILDRAAAPDSTLPASTGAWPSRRAFRRSVPNGRGRASPDANFRPKDH